MSRLERRLRDATQKIYSNDKRGPKHRLRLASSLIVAEGAFLAVARPILDSSRSFSRNRKGKFIKRRECFCKMILLMKDDILLQ